MERQVDWSFDRTTCKLGEKIRLKVTNLCSNSISFPKGHPVWVIRKEGETADKLPGPDSTGTAIEGGNNFTWEISTDDLKETGIYRVYPAAVDEDGTWSLWGPMKRAIIVEP